MAIDISQLEVSPLLGEIEGINPFLCYHCKKCTTGCPVAEEMDLAPNQIIRALQLGQIERVLNSKTIWVCTCCQTCTARCPMGIDVAGIMDASKILAQERGIEPKVPAVPLFVNASLRGIRVFGRLYELGSILELNLRRGEPLRDLGLGVRMLRRGKLRLLPQRAHYPRKLDQVKPRAEVKGIAYYPGCSLHGTAREYDMSMRAVAQKLGLELEEPEGWVCCGTTTAHWKSHLLAATLPMKNLALVEKGGHETLTAPCALCFLRHRRAIYDVEHDPHLREEVSQEIGYTFQGRVEVEHALDTFVHRVGLPAIAKAMVKPLRGLKVACYYGCLITRPPQVTGAEEAEYPMAMDHLMKALGAQPLDWSFKTECCGASHNLTQTEICRGLVRKILDNALEVGSEAVAVGCPMCHANLDSRQDGPQPRIPVFYFTQLMGLALGEERGLGLDRHFIDPRPFLKAKGFLT